MTVDLSKVGLEGMESFSQRKLADAQAAQLNSLANTNNFQLETDKREQELMQSAAEQLQNIAAGRGKQGPGFDATDVANDEDPADPLSVIGKVMIMGGAAEKGSEYLKASAEIRKKNADIQNDRVLAEQRRLENIIKGADIVARQLGYSRNQAEWDAALDALDGIMEPENIQALRNQGYNPDAAAFYREKAISAADMARNQLTQNAQDHARRVATDVSARDREKIELQTARDAETKRHNLATEKNAGKNANPTGAPSPQDLASAHATLKNMVFPDVKLSKDQYGRTKDDEFEAATQYVASRAKEILKNDPSASWDTAVRRAVLEGQAKNAFGVERGTKRWFSKDDPDKTKFESEKIAAPLPSQKSQLKKGTTYITSRGRAVWNGTAFDPVE